MNNSSKIYAIFKSKLQVLNEPGRRNTSKSYIWVIAVDGRIVQFYCINQYHRTRSGRVSLAFLDDYRGFIQSDDFSGYDHLDQNPDIVHLGCWAHARGKFVKVVMVRKRHCSKRENPKSLADEALGYIGKPYQIEKEARQQELDTAQIYQLRQKKSQTILK